MEYCEDLESLVMDVSFECNQCSQHIETFVYVPDPNFMAEKTKTVQLKLKQKFIVMNVVMNTRLSFLILSILQLVTSKKTQENILTAAFLITIEMNYKNYNGLLNLMNIRKFL